MQLGPRCTSVAPTAEVGLDRRTSLILQYAYICSTFRCASYSTPRPSAFSPGGACPHCSCACRRRRGGGSRRVPLRRASGRARCIRRIRRAPAVCARFRRLQATRLRAPRRLLTVPTCGRSAGERASDLRQNGRLRNGVLRITEASRSFVVAGYLAGTNSTERSPLAWAA